jgi:hypothetical protein
MSADVLHHLCPHHGGGAALGRLGLESAPAPKDDRAFLHFFGQLTDKLVEAAAKFMEVIDTECTELLGLTGVRIFSNFSACAPILTCWTSFRGGERGRPWHS